METTTSRTPRTGRRGRWYKLVWIIGGLVVLLGIAGLVVTSSAFFKAVILPRVGTALNAEVTVSHASIRPYSQVILRDLVVKPRDAETLLTAAEIRLR